MMAHARSRFGVQDTDRDGDAPLDRDDLRTDLALEAHQVAERTAPKSHLPGVQSVEESLPFGTLTRLEIQNEVGAKALGKPVGRYSTIQVPQLHERRRELTHEVGKTLATEIGRMLEHIGVAQGANMLVVGLGNWNATPDNVGPLTTSKLLVTRHLHEYGVLDEEALGQLAPVSALSPGVLGLTGVETAEIVKGVVERVKPQCVICIDALASRSIERLGTTFQLADVGINPGSGVGNKRMGLTKETLGVPVISIGCPTVIYATTIVSEAMDKLLERMGITPADGATPEFAGVAAGRGADVSTLDPSRIVVKARDLEVSSPQDAVGQNVNSNGMLDPAVRSDLIQEVLGPSMGRLVVTPKEVDLLVETLSDILADGLNEALHPGLSAEEAARLR